MSKTFIREQFYIEPPAADATQEEWAAWIASDDRKAAAAKGAHTKAQEAGTGTELPAYLTVGAFAVKREGVHRQEYTAWEGDASVGDASRVAIVQASQDRHFQARGKRAGTKAKGSRAQRRAKRGKRFGKKGA